MSHFAGRGKKTAWATWAMFPEVTEAFVRLSSLDSVYDEDFLRLFNLVQRFIILIYDRTCPLDDVNLCRKYLFTKKQRSIDGSPPTKDALMQHVKRCYASEPFVGNLLRQRKCGSGMERLGLLSRRWYSSTTVDNKAFRINGLLGVDFLQM